MNDNTFWACLWAYGAAVVITLIVSIHLSNVNTAKVKLEEHKTAIAAGLQQQLIGYEKVRVKIDKDDE